MSEALMHRNVVALAPEDLPGAQASVGDWCRLKIVELGRELREQRENLRQAKAMKWKHSGWLNAAAKTKKRMIYYAKLKAALAAGYLIVPNFDVDVIAVRVKSRDPNEKIDITRTKPELLPQQQGRYVDDVLVGHNEERTYKDSQGKDRTVTDFHPTHYGETLDFPASLVKPVVLAATQRAMALRIFDRVGIVRKSRRSDPIVVGQIINPSTHHYSLRDNPTCVTFFIAWWLDTRDL